MRVLNFFDFVNQYRVDKMKSELAKLSDCAFRNRYRKQTTQLNKVSVFFRCTKAISECFLSQIFLETTI